MYSDCEHEIKPVTTGHRVTLTYRLYQPSYDTRSSSQDSSSSDNLGSISAAHESAFGAQLAAALSDATWYPDGVTLGLVLEHFYAVESLRESLERDYSEGERGGWDYYNDTPSNMPEGIEPENLKGADLQLYRAARALGLDVQIVPVASLEQFDEYDAKLGVAAASSKPRSPSKLAVFGSFSDDPTGGDEYDPTERHDSWAEFLLENIAEHCAPPIKGELLWIKLPGKQHLKYCGPAKEYEGNSANTTCFYAAGALLLVEVPAVGAPQRQG